MSQSMSSHTHKCFQEEKAILSSSIYKIIEDPGLWTLPSCQAYLRGRESGQEGPQTCFVLFLFALSILKVGTI